MGGPDLGAYLCDGGHELRVTCRCIREDLGDDPPVPFDNLVRHPIVAALRTKRTGQTIGSKTVGPHAGGRTLHHLGRGDDHRGATWWDPANGVVWLLAAGRHRSGQLDDAFQYFDALTAEGRMYPEEEDYLWLEEDRDRRFARRFHADAQSLLQEARGCLGTEFWRMVGGEQVGVLVDVVETLEETFVVFRVDTIGDATKMTMVLSGLYPDREYDDWRMTGQIPTRHLDSIEFAYAILHCDQP